MQQKTATRLLADKKRAAKQALEQKLKVWKSISKTSKTSEARQNILNRLERQIGLHSKELHTDKSGTHLKFSLKVEGRCHLGDIDGILSELKHSPGSRLLATVEPLEPDKRWRTAAHVISVADLEKGIDHEFSIPSVQQPTSLGFYICKDSSGIGRCSEKDIVDFNKILSQYKGHLQNNFRATDKIYYFQYLLVDKKAVKVFSKNLMTADMYGKLNWLLRLSMDDSKSANKAARIKLLNDRVSSVGADTESLADSLALTLPKYDRLFCKRRS